MIVYLAHPVGSGEDRAKNLELTQKWFLWLFEHAPKSWSINVPWFIYVSNLDESPRVRAMRDDLRILDTSRAIVLCGAKLSPGMQTELGQALLSGLYVYDLTQLGLAEPPIPGTAQHEFALGIVNA